MKASSNGGGIKAIFLQHAEKMVLAIAMVLVALFLWSATGVKPIESAKSPDVLKAEAEKEIARIPAEDPPPVEPLPDFAKRVEVGLSPIEEISAYTHSTKIMPEISPAIVKRAEPTLFAVEDLRATATVVSVPELGVTPTWKEPTDEKEKKKAVKKAVKKADLDSDAPTPRRRGKRGQPGYGAPTSKMGYGQSTTGGAAEMPPHAGPAGRRSRGSSEDREGGYGAPKGPGYGQPGMGYGMATAGPHPGAQVAGTQDAKGEVRAAVVLTGRVPYAAQFEEFQKRFKEAVTYDGWSPEMDIPKYLQFKVERQEVTASGATDWKALDLDALEKAEVNWAVSPEENVDQTYIYGNDYAQNILAWPMPPAIQRAWGRLETHPSVPLMWMDVEAQTGIMRREFDPEQSRRRARQPTTGYGLDGGAGPRYPGRGREGGYSPEGGYGAEVAQTPHVPHLLFRFVDTDKLEAGKQYRYRVSLEVENPNFQVPFEFLENTASASQETRWTPPAESPVVAVLNDRKLLALSSKGNWPDRAGQFLFHAFDKKMGVEIAKEFEVKLGGIAEFVSTVENWYNPYTGAGENVENYHFRFDDGPPMLADVDGGTSLSGASSVKQPAEMLFIDAKGRLFTSNQASDSATAEFYKERYTLVPETTDTGPSILDSETAPGSRDFGGRR